MKKIMRILLVVIVLLIMSIAVYYFIKDDNKKETKQQKEKVTNTTTTTKVKEENIMDGISINYHASIRINKENTVIYFDPYKIEGNLNDADYVFITHSHYDHYSDEDIKKVMNDDTKFIITSDLESRVINLGISKENITVVYPSRSYTLDNLKFDTIPSYNINKSYHKKLNNWVGYNLTLNGNSYYVVGDSDVTDELKSVKCDVIFIPVGGTYTMTDEEASLAVNEMKPKYAIPIHYGEVGSSENARKFIEKLDDNIKGVILK